MIYVLVTAAHERFSFGVHVEASSLFREVLLGIRYINTRRQATKSDQGSHEYAWSERLLSSADAESSVSRPASRAAFLLT